jgi:hypothetical protein
MELRVTYGFPSTLPAPSPARPSGARDSASASLIYEGEIRPAGKDGPSNQTRLIDESREEGENRVRRTRVFEQPDGRTFTRVEEIGLTANGARRIVIQQNPSGSITRYEEVLDRDGSGTFRRTQRFQNEAGDIAAQITPGYQVNDPFVLTGGNSPLSFDIAGPFAQTRGTQLDLTA